MVLRSEPMPLVYQIPSLPPEGADHDLITIVKCSSFLEAHRVVKKLKRTGIVARIPNKVGVALSDAADLRNCYPHIRIQVARADYAAAREQLSGAD